MTKWIKMKCIKYLILLFGTLVLFQNTIIAQKKPLSPPAEAMGMIGDAHILIDYSSPRVRDRTIFGGLLPYGKIWVAGAGDATWIEFNKDLIIHGKVISAGKYGLFVIPNKDKWTLIINTRWNQHGTQKYHLKEDVFRVDITPVRLKTLKEQLEYQIIKTNEESGVISLTWETLKIEVPFTLQSK